MHSTIRNVAAATATVLSFALTATVLVVFIGTVGPSS